MKAVSIVLGAVFGLMILLIAVGGSAHKAPQTKYQECVETAKHLRSDRDTNEFINTICERLPVEAGDYR